MRVYLNTYRLIPIGSVVCLLLYLYILNSKELKQPYVSYKTSKRTIQLFKNVNTNLTFSINTLYPSIKNDKDVDKQLTHNTKFILLWTPFFGDWNWNFLPIGKRAFMNCRIRDCYVTINSTLLIQSDAVVFHARDISVYSLPKERNKDQKWIFYSLESPHYSYFGGFHVLNGVFNWTMSYRLDSDIVMTYGKVEPNPFSSVWNEQIGRDVWRRKKRLVIWMVSHCETASKRENYVKKLKKYIDIDIFGTCGRAVCPANRTADCLKSFSAIYKFYLSFENSICKDYVTEKFFQILQYDMVPVVYGGADYKKIAPPNSYIDALQFSPKELADYLYKVANNYTLYNSYMNWKASYKTIVSINHCDLCYKLHKNKTKTVIKDLKSWWIDEAKCRTLYI
ncbi:alpha-(1,3)-fucosyltransferase C-like [Centruroides vittatus]|uniref:alpha-(1,3)-fucosyltransferase C-like n=1 Tax=Centruroides vittatus TaxID=120091 RepID=UPI00350E9C8E